MMRLQIIMVPVILSVINTILLLKMDLHESQKLRCPQV